MNACSNESYGIEGKNIPNFDPLDSFQNINLDAIDLKVEADHSGWMQQTVGNRIQGKYERGEEQTQLQKERSKVIIGLAVACVIELGIVLVGALVAVPAFYSAITFAGLALLGTVFLASGVYYCIIRKLDLDIPLERRKAIQQIATKTFSLIHQSYTLEEIVGYRLLDGIVSRAIPSAAEFVFYSKFASVYIQFDESQKRLKLRLKEIEVEHDKVILPKKIDQKCCKSNLKKESILAAQRAFKQNLEKLETLFLDSRKELAASQKREMTLFREEMRLEYWRLSLIESSMMLFNDNQIVIARQKKIDEEHDINKQLAKANLMMSQVKYNSLLKAKPRIVNSDLAKWISEKLTVNKNYFKEIKVLCAKGESFQAFPYVFIYYLLQNPQAIAPYLIAKRVANLEAEISKQNSGLLNFEDEKISFGGSLDDAEIQLDLSFFQRKEIETFYQTTVRGFTLESCDPINLPILYHFVNQFGCERLKTAILNQIKECCRGNCALQVEITLAAKKLLHLYPEFLVSIFPPCIESRRQLLYLAAHKKYQLFEVLRQAARKRGSLESEVILIHLSETHLKVVEKLNKPEFSNCLLASLLLMKHRYYLSFTPETKGRYPFLLEQISQLNDLWSKTEAYFNQCTKENDQVGLIQARRLYGNAIGLHSLRVSQSDLPLAIAHCKKALEIEVDANIQFQLGVFYLNVPSFENVDLALNYFRAAAEYNHSGALVDLALTYEGLKGVVIIDRFKAAQFYLEAAQLDNAYSQWYLGLCYKQAVGFPLDLTLAKYWYKRALNNPNATNDLKEKVQNSPSKIAGILV